MLGTKLRALFQRETGRDLFDLFWGLTKSAPPADPSAAVESFEKAKALVYAGLRMNARDRMNARLRMNARKSLFEGVQ